MLRCTAAFNFCDSSSSTRNNIVRTELSLAFNLILYLLQLDKYELLFSYNLMANWYFSCLRKLVAFSFTNLAWAKLSSGVNFHDCGSFSKSSNVTVYSTVASGGILNFSLPAVPNAYSGLMTSLKWEEGDHFSVSHSEIELRMSELPRCFAFAKLKKSRLNARNDIVFRDFTNIEWRLTILEHTILIFTNQMNCMKWNELFQIMFSNYFVTSYLLLTLAPSFGVFRLTLFFSTCLKMPPLFFGLKSSGFQLSNSIYKTPKQRT